MSLRCTPFQHPGGHILGALVVQLSNKYDVGKRHEDANSANSPIHIHGNNFGGWGYATNVRISGDIRRKPIQCFQRQK